MVGDPGDLTDDDEDTPSPALAAAIALAASRLAPNLARANRATYLRQLQAIAHAQAQLLPTQIDDQDALDGIDARAQASAQSIANTQATRMASFIAGSATLALAVTAFKHWEQGQRELIARYESSMTTHAALADWIGDAQPTGVEHVEPEDAVCDECQEAVAEGYQKIGYFSDFPIHANCQHYVQIDFDLTGP